MTKLKVDSEWCLYFCSVLCKDLLVVQKIGVLGGMWMDTGQTCVAFRAWQDASQLSTAPSFKYTQKRRRMRRGAAITTEKIKGKGIVYATTGMGNDSASNAVLNPLKKVLAMPCLKLLIVNSLQNTHTLFSFTVCGFFFLFPSYQLGYHNFSEVGL